MTIAGFGTGGAAFVTAMNSRKTPTKEEIEEELIIRSAEDKAGVDHRKIAIPALFAGEPESDVTKPQIAGFF